MYMAKTSVVPSREILEAALHGLEAQRQKLDEQIAQVKTMMGRRVGRPPKGGAEAASTSASPARKKRSLSPEARKRIAAAQKKRWANFRKSEGQK
jgi:peptidoglycan hydrolase CwlO-like protein